MVFEKYWLITYIFFIFEIFPKLFSFRSTFKNCTGIASAGTPKIKLNGGDSKTFTITLTPTYVKYRFEREAFPTRT